MQVIDYTVFRFSIICNGIFPGLVWLTFLHWCTCSQSHWSWLHSCHFPCDMVSAHISMLVHCVLTLLYGDIKCIIKNVWKMAIAYIISQNSTSIKTCVMCTPLPFLEARQLCTKGVSRSSILGSFWAPHYSTSINVFELFFHCAVVHWYVYW